MGLHSSLSTIKFFNLLKTRFLFLRMTTHTCVQRHPSQLCFLFFVMLKNDVTRSQLRVVNHLSRLSIEIFFRITQKKYLQMSN